MSEIPPGSLDWLVDGLLAALLVSLAGALVVGLWLLAHPSSLLRLNTATSRWLSLRRSLRPVELPLHWEPKLYRHHRLAGGIVLAAAGYALYRWAFAFDRAALLRYLDAAAGWDAGWIVDGGEIVFVAMNLLLLPVGVVLIVRPSLLKGLESWGNRWVSTRRASRPLDLPHEGVDRLAARHPRLIGAAIVLLSLYCLLALALSLA